MDLNQILNKAKELQDQYKKQQAQAAEKTIEAQVGGGMVKVVINGLLEIQSITLDPEVVDKAEIETLQDLIIAGVNEAIKKGREIAGGNMAEMMKNFQMPDMGNFDFNQFKK